MRRSERAQMAGIESIPFGILVFVAGTLLIVNAWATVTTRTTATSIAREYLRAYTNAPSQPEAIEAGDRAARAVAAAHDIDSTQLRIERPVIWEPCGVAVVAVTITVPEIRAPFLGGFGSTEVRVQHRDRLDPYRVGLGSPGPAGGPDACG